MKNLILVAALLLLVPANSFGQSKTDSAFSKIKMKTLAGKDVQMSKYAGKVVVFVNVASKCGFTPQYEGLQDLQEKFADKEVAVVGVPCNQFGGQEPGSAEEIATFCKDKYGVEFEMLEKVDVNGKSQCELYKYLTGFDTKPVGKGPVKWNFEKIVVDASGTPIARFGSKVKPNDSKLVTTIESALTATPISTSQPYSHVSEKSGKTYYLFYKEVPLKNSDGVSTIYYFAKDPNNSKGSPLAAVPADRVVSETKTGMLVLKKKK